MKKSSRFHNILVFLGFVIIATVFWFVLALNDSVQSNYSVKIQIINAPDSVKFISDVPEDMHVSVRDRGSTLLRTAIMRHPTVNFNFRDFADSGKFFVSRSDINAQLKVVFGSTASILSTSLDSLNLVYTTNKGRRIPVVVVNEITPAPGMFLAGEPKATPNYVMVYGPREELDTVTRVFTEKIIKRDLSENQIFEVKVNSLKGLRIEPPKVKVQINVEPLVNKTEVIPISIIGVPEGESLLLFPSQVTVEYFVPMSRFSSEKDSSLKAEVEYQDAYSTQSGRVKVSLVVTDKQILNPRLLTDSVEYTIVK